MGGDALDTVYSNDRRNITRDEMKLGKKKYSVTDMNPGKLVVL